MGQKIYIIRKSAYGYTDEFFYERNLGAITDTFTDEAEAYQQLTALEVPLFRYYDMGEIEQLSPCVRFDQFREERLALDSYLKEILGKSFLVTMPNSDFLYADMNTYLPKTMTDEQIMKMRDITGIRFHEMSMFEDEVLFYAIWLPHKNTYLHVDGGEFGQSTYFFDTYEQALANVTQGWADSQFMDTHLSGELYELSDQPTMLKSLLVTAIGLNYNPEQKVIEFSYGLTGESLAALSALLKQPLFEIREFPYEQAKDVPHDPFEYM